MTAPHDTQRRGRSWTIYVCPECGHRDVWKGALLTTIRCPWESVRHGRVEIPPVVVAPVQSEGERELEAANARELLLRDALEQAQNTVEFMHGCLTEDGFVYACPEQTQRHLDEWAALAPRREPCFHSRTKRACVSCVDRQERYHALAEARALLRDLEAKPRLSHSGPLESKGSPPTPQEARTDG